MKVLVAVASKHGSTRDIGAAIAEELRKAGLDAELRDAAAVEELAGYDAVVLGSAVYAGQWMQEARRFVEANRAALRTLPVWLFSSGPIGDPPKPDEDPKEVAGLVTDLGARGHRTFAGRLDPDNLGFAERLVAKVVRAQAGDFRDWDAIRAWAGEIAGALLAGAAPVAAAAPAGAPVAPE